MAKELQPLVDSACPRLPVCMAQMLCIARARCPRLDSAPFPPEPAARDGP
jgi:hypothetical protein